MAAFVPILLIRENIIQLIENTKKVDSQVKIRNSIRESHDASQVRLLGQSTSLPAAKSYPPKNVFCYMFTEYFFHII